MVNLFLEAKRLLESKSVSDMTAEELLVVKAALIPLTILPQFNDMTIFDGLEELAKMTDRESPELKQALIESEPCLPINI